MREQYSFRFLPEEIAEMRRVLEKNGYSRPMDGVMGLLAFSFSKTRQEQGMSCVRVASILSWFKRHRGGYTKSRTGRPRAKSEKSRQRSLAARPISLVDEKHIAEDEASEKSSSVEGSSEGEMSESAESEQGGSEHKIQYHDVNNSVDCMDTTLQPLNPPQGPVTEADGVVPRQVGYSNVQSESGPEAILRKCTDSSTLFKIGQAKATLEKLKGLSMVVYRKCEEEIKLAVKVLTEEGCELLSETEKVQLPLLPENLHKIAKENDRVRKEMADCGAFLEKVKECEENTVRLIEKARLLEEKYNAFPQSISTFSNKGDDLETSAFRAKAEAEKMKGAKEDVVAQLVRVAECLQSASTHHTILKAEEAAVVQKRNKLMESLRKNSEEWVKLTNSKTYMSFI